MELSVRCPRDDVFAAWLEDRLGSDDRVALESHLDRCDGCRMVFAELSRVDGESPTARSIGRFEVERLLGEGGMGQVFLAHDPELDRDVALKLVRDDLELGAPATDRLLREARTQAQLTHPNVVTVYEVGRLDDASYIAMEYVDGLSVSEWLETARPWSEVVDVFTAAGRGLAAAHSVDLVHRDFKPANVMIGSDGRVLVTDFGLARSAGDSGTGRRYARALTATGAAVGTPAYMAPEQFRAEPADASSDQFAFCVSMFEGLYGFRPFAAANISEQQEAVSSGVVPEPPPGSAVPRWLHDIVCRGLAADPQRRFATMEDLLGCIESRLPRSRQVYDCPYPGLSRFGADDADRFFGREAEIESALRLLEEKTMLAVLGPSGAGKSSFLRAGVAVEMNSRVPTEVITVRPGHDPAERLARLTRSLDPAATSLAQALERFARSRNVRVLLIVDQLEELFTLGDSGQREKALAELVALPRDPAAPVRVAVAIRSDLLDRAGEHRELIDWMIDGLMFLAAPDERMIRDALTRPLELVGYKFESPDIADDIASQLAGVQGALPLLQFAARKMWELRDRDRQVIDAAAYTELGQLSGVLATHADNVVSHLASGDRALAREVITRLVTPDRTRDLVPTAELETLGDVGRIIDALVEARLIVVNADSVAELVHESLIDSWPRLSSWLDRDAETGAMLAEIGTAARRWDARGRPAGMLWTGDAVTDARRFRERHRGPLSAVESEFVDAVIRASGRRKKVRRVALVASFAILIGLVAAASVGLIAIRAAEREAREAEGIAKEREAEAEEAQAETRAKLDLLRAEKSERARAEAAANRASRLADTRKTEVVRTRADLEISLRETEKALERARREEARAREALEHAKSSAASERQAKAKLEKLVAEKQAKIRELEKRRQRVISIE